MEAIDHFLRQNWLTLLVGLIGLIATYFFYRKSLIKHEMAFQRKAIAIIGRNSILPSEVEIFFKGKKVPLVTKSIIALWNNGNSTIMGEQIAHQDPLRILPPQETEILDAQIQKITRTVTGISISVEENPNQVILTFDYLDPSDGALITVLHTGEKDVQILGTLRGLPRGLLDLGSIDFQKRTRISRLMEKVSLISPLIMVALAISAFFIALDYPLSYLWTKLTYIYSFGAFIVSAILLFIVRKSWRKPPKQLVDEEDA